MNPGSSNIFPNVSFNCLVLSCAASTSIRSGCLFHAHFFVGHASNVDDEPSMIVGCRGGVDDGVGAAGGVDRQSQLAWPVPRDFALKLCLRLSSRRMECGKFVPSIAFL